MWKRVSAGMIGGWGILALVVQFNPLSLQLARAIFGLGSLLAVGVGWLYSVKVLESSLSWGTVTGWSVVGSTLAALGIVAVAGGLGTTGESGVLFTIRGFMSGVVFGLFLSLINYAIRGPLPNEEED